MCVCVWYTYLLLDELGEMLEGLLAMLDERRVLDLEQVARVLQNGTNAALEW